MQPTPELILVVNDNEAGRYATSRILARAGFQTLEASTGEEGLRLARSASPQMVVLDINLPDMNGIEVGRQLKADPKTTHIMILQVSATNVQLADRVSALSAGADSFLIDPVEPEELEAVIRALLRLQRSEAQLRRTLSERELLLREVNHRVKNSLQLVLSMLSLQSAEFRESSAKELFAKAIARVTAIASIHERLYQDNDPLTLDMQAYLNGLCAELERAGIGDERQAQLKCDVESIRLPTENGVSLALIVNELVMNSLKHGRPVGRPAVINVRLHRHDGDQARLTVADNGPGMEAKANPPTGLGTRLISMLVRQLNGHLNIEDSADGFATHVTFPLRPPVTWGPES
jgi:two-component sensor histidine kinase/CheY-like chemotaxis protein